MTASVRLCGVVLGVVVAASGPALGVAPAGTETIGATTRCHSSDQAFAPVRLAVDHVLPSTRVLSRGQDAYGVPEPPPLTRRGRWQLAWDRESGVLVGDSAGVVRMTAHTYPRDAGRFPALGNLLLARLHPGARLVVSGAGGERLCYRVTRRRTIRSTATSDDFYDTTGAPRLAILVCSGTRRGPGDWSHRTIWWAEPFERPRSASAARD